MKAAETPSHTHWRSLEQDAQAHRRLAEDRENTIAEIRKLPGFETFLGNTPFMELARASDQGIVVVLSINIHSCEALILPHEYGDAINVQLKNIDYKKAASLRARMAGVLANADVRARATTLVPREGLEYILRELWEDIVRPSLTH
jgi:hypothetical protein